MASIGLVCNLFNECNALPGWLETHLSFFDDVRAYHAGPSGLHSVDGTLDILKKWDIPVKFGSIDSGFGNVRTEALRWSPCDWVVILDVDERLFPVHRVLTCQGEPTSRQDADVILGGYDTRDPMRGPDWEAIARLGANLRVERGDVIDQGAWLREIINTGNHDAVVTIRRHWHDIGMKHPTQSWAMEPDWQLRCVRNDPSIYFDPSTRMHERLIGVNRVFYADLVRGPFFDHFHFHFKKMEPAQRAHDVDTYDRIHRGEKPLSWKEFTENTRSI